MGDAAGRPGARRGRFDVVLIETVGVGQSEVDVVKLADTTVVLLAPGMGDGIQAAKAGVLEIADVFVVNKADREGADATVHDLKQMISLVRREIRGPSWRQPIVRTVASRGEGVEDVVRALDEHHDWLVQRDELPRRRAARARDEVEAIAVQRLRAEIVDLRSGDRLTELAERVVARKLDPFAAAEELIADLRGS